MSTPILKKDTDLQFPHLILLKASAGSGKTHALTERFVQFILSEKVPKNNLRNILAITFSNNAAKEMKTRILSWLKQVCFKDPEKIGQLSQILSFSEQRLSKRAEELIDEVLLNYTDFQVRTIDSFMTSIYKASAIDLGYSPDFEIRMSPDAVMAYAFNRFLRRVRAGTREAHLLEELLDLIMENKESDSAYLWDPLQGLLDEVKELYSRLSSIVKEVSIVDRAEETEAIKSEIREKTAKLNKLIEKSGLERSKKSTFKSIVEAAERGSFPDLIEKGIKTLPVLKPKDAATNPSYQQIGEQWHDLGEAIKKYTERFAFDYYLPYLKTYEAFKDILERIKREEGTIFIDDINKKLSDYLDHEIVPDIYFRIGETIYHYLIDEFQDTSPIQWSNLFPLIENSLAQGGSFFGVGDTKQAIYGFRNADYRIMRRLEKENPFASAHHEVRELNVNYRSLEQIVRFNENFFQKVVPSHSEYQEAASQSGLSDYEQHVKKEHAHSGYVETLLCERNDEEPPERIKIQSLIHELKGRGYRYSDIAVLTFTNEDVVNVTTWLNEIDVPFISYSSLDIRTRKITQEIFFLLRFLDSPPDNLSFGGFLLGDIFRKNLEQSGKQAETGRLHDFLFRNRKQGPLYKLFQEGFGRLWTDYFEKLFKSTGYLPLYDLVSEIYRHFRVFENFPEEEATLVRILEVIHEAEKKGMNHPGDFLNIASDEEAGEANWNIDVPADIDAVKVMTIHKAKGLGFRAVILLVYEERTRGFKYILHEEPNQVSLLKINKKISESGPLLQEAYEEERMKDLVNRLNTLYVGFTRPEDELYVIGVSGTQKRFPMGLLEEAPCSDVKKVGTVRASKEEDQARLLIQHHFGEIDLGSGLLREELNIEERQRGEFIHRVLCLFDWIDDDLEKKLDSLLLRVKHETRADYSPEEMKKILLGFLRHEDAKPYFIPRPGRIVNKEQEFSDKQGNLFRMDRVIIDEHSVTVMDYKTGQEKKPEQGHVPQLKNYMRILKEIYPDKKVEGLIGYVDIKEIKKIT